MPELRDVLRSAAPVPTSELDLGRVRRRAAQRRRWGVLVVGGSLVVVAAVVASVIVALVGDDESRRVRTVDQPGVPSGSALTLIDAPGVRGVAVSGHALWVTRERTPVTPARGRRSARPICTHAAERCRAACDSVRTYRPTKAAPLSPQNLIVLRTTTRGPLDPALDTRVVRRASAQVGLRPSPPLPRHACSARRHHRLG